MDTVFFYFPDWRDMSNARDFFTEDYKPTLATSFQSEGDGELYFPEGKQEDIQAFRDTLAQYKLRHTESNVPTKDWSHPFAREFMKI